MGFEKEVIANISKDKKKSAADPKRRGRPGQTGRSIPAAAASSKRCPPLPTKLPRVKRSSHLCDDDMSPTGAVPDMPVPGSRSANAMETVENDKENEAPKDVHNRRLSDMAEAASPRTPSPARGKRRRFSNAADLLYFSLIE